MSVLEIRNLHATVEGKEILKGVNLTLKSGEIHAMMGPNGSGKSTLAYVMAGHPHYEVTEGDVLIDGQSILDMEADERCKAGLFLAFQYPVAVPGVSVANFLRTAVSNVRGYTAQNGHANGNGSSGVVGSNLMPMREFRKELNDKMKEYNVDPSFARRYLNDGFSGGDHVVGGGDGQAREHLRLRDIGREHGGKRQQPRLDFLRRAAVNVADNLRDLNPFLRSLIDGDVHTVILL